MGPGTATETLGRHGELTLEYAREGSRTVLVHSHCRSPWHFFPPIDLDDGACAYTLLVNPSGGLVGGDHLMLRASIQAGAHVLFSTPSANRVYRTLGEPALQTIGLHGGPDAVVEWLPDPTIPFAGARYRQQIGIELEPGASLIFWDVLAAGRIASGERWAFTEVESEIRVALAGGGTVLERYRIVGDDVGLAAKWNYVATCFVISERLTEPRRQALADRFAAVVDRGPVLMAGVSEPALPGLAVRILAMDVTELKAVLEDLWGAARAELVNRTAPALRRY